MNVTSPFKLLEFVNPLDIFSPSHATQAPLELPKINEQPEIAGALFRLGAGIAGQRDVRSLIGCGLQIVLGRQLVRLTGQVSRRGHEAEVNLVVKSRASPHPNTRAAHRLTVRAAKRGHGTLPASEAFALRAAGRTFV